MGTRPSKGTTTSRFGVRTDPLNGTRRQHNGMDIAHNAGVELVAPERSQLVSYGTVGDWGRLAVLRAGDTEHRLAHTERLAPGVAVGDWIDEGQLVAIMGTTGRSTGVHLHWEVVQAGRYIDPAGWLAATAGTTTTTTTTTTHQEDEMPATYINVKGQAGKRRGGCYAIMRDAAGKLFARFVSGQPLAGAPTIEGQRELDEWDKTVPGLS